MIIKSLTKRIWQQYPPTMDQDIPGETFQKASDIANKVVQKADEV